MKIVDYWWIWPIVIIILIAIFWNQLSAVFMGGSAKLLNKEGVENGQVLFSDASRWSGAENYRSCAMCHDPGFKPDPNKKIDMTDYDPDKKVILKGLKSKFRGGILSDDLLAEQVNGCIIKASRMNGMKQDEAKDKDFQDLLAYLRTL